jgi:four helix bundle protein
VDPSDWIIFKNELKDRFKKFALDIIQLVKTLPNSNECRVIGNQLLKSGTSCYANFRAALRSRSKAEYYSKLCIVVEETDETELWLELLIESKSSVSELSYKLHNESMELLKLISHLRKKSSKN